MQLLFQIQPSELGGSSNPVVKWSRDAKYLACFGNNNQVLVYDRNGAKIASIPVTNPKFMEWDIQSKILVITSGSSQEITVFYLSKRETNPVEAPFTPSWIQCSRRGSLLAAGSEKGKFWICDLSSRESQTYQGTHDNTIVDGCWNSRSHLALCSDDMSVSVSSVSGNVIARKDIGDVPVFPHFITMDQNLTLVFAGKNSPAIYFWEYSSNKNDNFTKYEFNSSFGSIIKCTTLSNTHVYIQFSGGKFILFDSLNKENIERFAFPSSATCADSVHSKALVGSGSSVKLITMEDPKNITDETARFPNGVDADVTSISLTSDGTVGAVGLDSGDVLVWLVEVPILSASSGPTSVYSQSLTTLAVYDMHKKSYKSINVESQPHKLGVCLKKVAVAFNNKCIFYDAKTCDLLTTVELSATVDSIQVSETAFAVLMGGRLMLNYFDESKRPFNFPDFETNVKVSAFALTGFLLLLATDDGAVRIFNTRNQAFLDGYKHPVPITLIKANLSETRFVFIDASHGVFLFNPIKRTVQEVSSNGGLIDAENALFDITDRNVFAIISSHKVSVYHFTDHNVDGPTLTQLCQQNVPSLKSALGLSNGTLIFLDPQSQEQSQTLTSHSHLLNENADSVKQLLDLHRHRSALQIALKIGDKALLRQVGETALKDLAIEIASEAFSASGDAAMYNILDPIKKEEEFAYLRGYVSMLNKDFNSAQKSFLESTRPQMALDMRAALLQFESALTLAEKFDPSRIPQLSVDSARQNELTGNYSVALQQYKVSYKTQKFAKQSRAGIIRCLILAGKVEEGMKHLEKIKDQALITECAKILERLSAFQYAATLYNQVHQYNSAAQCFLRANDLKSASDIISKVDDTKVLRSIGMQLERSGQLEASASAFERANEWESLVRVYLKINLDRATAIARQHPTVAACRLVAEHCIQLGNFRYAIEFLIISGRADDAFRLAESHQRMDELADLIGDSGTEQQYETIATYFRSRNDKLSAAKFFAKADQPHHALDCYIEDGSYAAMDAALELAEKIEDRTLRDRLLTYLSSSNKNECARDLRYLLRMFIILKQFDEAETTATKIADDYRQRGEYRASRDLLFDIIRQLQKHNYTISAEMRNGFMLVHSYLLIKPLKETDQMISALLLRRLSKFISKFPSNSANILCSTVAECTRAGFKKSAYEAATKLISAEYETKVQPEIYKKIEQTVRRKNTEEADEPKTPCPVCSADVHISELYCGSCKSNIPFDTLTGMHMTKDDWFECPACHFPASHSRMCIAKKCPLCNERVEVPEIVKNPRIY